MTWYYLKSYLPLLLMGAIGCTPLPKKVWTFLSCKLQNGQKYSYQNIFVGLAETAFMLILLFLCTGYLISGSYQTFLYFRF